MSELMHLFLGIDGFMGIVGVCQINVSWCC